MKMSKKMIIIFSLLILITTATITISFFFAEVTAVNEKTYATLSTLGSRMVFEIEQYVLMMDYTLDEMLTNPDYMGAFNEIYTQGSDIHNINKFLTAQNTLSSVMYRVPLFGNFYSVNIFTRDGFFLSNRFQKTDTVVSLSDEALEIIESIDWLDMADANAFQRHLIPPHDDPWTSVRVVNVFSAVRAAVWRGRHIGYFEVSALVSDLDQIFTVENRVDISVQVILGTGKPLYKTVNSTHDYNGLENGFIEFTNQDGHRTFVYTLESKWLNLKIHISQDDTAFIASMLDLILRYAVISCAVSAATMLLVIVISLRLTNSIQKLTKKVKLLPLNYVLDNPEESILNKAVVSRGDIELSELERVFDDLLIHLRSSLQKELAMKEYNHQAQLNALQAQVTPHFIYNTLNIISAKSMESGNEEIITICAQFANMLRYSTDFRSKTAYVKDELNHVRLYLSLVKARFESHLSYEINIPPDIESVILPKLTLQPLVENALTHGFINTAHPMRITIEGIVNGDGFKLVIRDNGDGFSQDVLDSFQAISQKIESDYGAREVGLRVGLFNTVARLNYYSKGAMVMNIYNNGGAVVEILMTKGTGE